MSYLKSYDLQLSVSYGVEWDSYVHSLYISGVTLSKSRDHLVWGFNKMDGMVNEK